ncbi:hypothetical protein F4823DRAFT_588112 [Ustulina deusta]|nr:hypothetical protein F4823DRAFT_588112 [Ustulina deusta]
MTLYFTTGIVAGKTTLLVPCQQKQLICSVTAEVVSGALSIALIAYILQRSEANYLDGVMLIGLYIIIMSNFIFSSVFV